LNAHVDIIIPQMPNPPSHLPMLPSPTPTRRRTSLYRPTWTARGPSRTAVSRTSSSHALYWVRRRVTLAFRSTFLCAWLPPISERAHDRTPVLRAAPHYTGDGNTLHQTTQELLVLVSSAKTNHELELELEREIQVEAVCVTDSFEHLTDHDITLSESVWQTQQKTNCCRGPRMPGFGLLPN
jgi:hypothetical protein